MKSSYHSLIAIYLFLFCHTIFRGQEDKTVDSLKFVVSSNSDIAEKIKAYDLLFELFIYNDTEKALEFTKDLDSVANKVNNPEGIIRSTLNLGYYYYVEEKMDSAELYLRRTLDLSKGKEVKDIVLAALDNLSLVEAHKGNYIISNQILDSLGGLYLVDGNYLRYGVTINNIAANHYDQGNYLTAMEGYQKALKVLDTIQDEPYRKADVLRNIGKLNTRQGQLDSALDYLNQALEIYLEIGDNLYAASTFIDIGSVHSDLGDYTKAIEFYEKGLKIGDENNQGSVSVLALGNIGIAYLEQENYLKAIGFLEKSLNYKGSDLSDINKTIYLYQIGKCYTNLKKYELASQYLDSSITIATNQSIGNELLNALELKSINNEEKGDLKNALVNIRLSNKLKDSLFSLENSNKIKELQTIYETEKKEAEIALQHEEIKTLNEKSRADNLKKGLYAGGMASALAVSGLLFFGFRQRIKKNRIAREKQEEIYKQEIEHKKKELTSQTLHLVQKNTFIQELMENLENIKNSPEKFKMEFRRIVMLLKKENASDKDWEVFKSYFADVHNDFDQKLKTIYPDISEKEIRLAAFLRMNLTTKEIAATLNVLPDSILKSKYRLKKKLGLDKETDLNQFLNTL
ncbi:tetratricopeptide repeat protein [Maribacter algicola]|nr:tetratricopeptide repeat protein [Maribacter algicola]